jgi:N-acetyl-1-D-myo-inositol-2-amino-2-deoxy-alpha-D-glucopyranoside deacetylase
MASHVGGASRRQIILALLTGTLVIAFAYARSGIGTSDPLADVASVIRPERFGERVLVIAPHPDDETLAPGGLVSELSAAGAGVRVVVLTSGDAFRNAAIPLAGGRLTPEVYRKLGRIRHQESESSLANLGVPPEDRIFLCYADGSLNALWDRDWDTDKPHLGRNGAISVPYDYAWRPGTVYCGANLAADLETILREYAPTSIVYPDAADTHHDHWAASAFTEHAMAVTAFGGGRYTYLVHWGQYPFPWAYLPNAYLRPFVELTGIGTTWWSLPLDQRAEATKARSVGLFKSQLRLPHMNVYLRAFIRRNELFGTYAAPAARFDELDRGPSAAPDNDDIVIREPRRSGVASLLGQPGTVADVRMTRGPKTAWIGITTFDGSPPDLRYVYEMRLYGGGDASRMDVTVTATSAVAARIATDSVVPVDLRVERMGGTVWLGFPSSLLEGRDWCLLSGAAYPKRAFGKGYRSAWRPVRL